MATKGSRSWLNRSKGVKPAKNDYTAGGGGGGRDQFKLLQPLWQVIWRYIYVYLILNIHPFDTAILYYVLFKDPVVSCFPNSCSTCTCPFPGCYLYSPWCWKARWKETPPHTKQIILTPSTCLVWDRHQTFQINFGDCKYPGIFKCLDICLRF